MQNMGLKNLKYSFFLTWILFLIFIPKIYSEEKIHENDKSLIEKAQKEHQLGKEAWQKQDFLTALKHFKNAAEHDKNNEVNYSNAGICASYLGKDNEAVNWFKKAIEIAIIKKKFIKIEQFNDQISKILNVWPDWAETRLNEQSTLPEDNEIIKIHQQWYKFIEQSNHLIEMQENDKALEFLHRSLEIARSGFGKKHIFYADNLFTLANVYHEQGDYNNSAKFFNESFEVYKRIIGEEHPKSIFALKNLASLYEEQGNFEKAKEIYDKCISLCMKGLGENHAETLEILFLLSSINNQLNNNELSIQLLKKCLTAYSKIFGSNHPNAIYCMEELAALYKYQLKYDSAEPILKNLLKIKESISGEKNPDTMNTILELGELYLLKEDYDASEVLLKKALKGFKEILGDYSREVFDTKTLIARLYEERGLYKEAFEIYKDVYMYDLKNLGGKHPNTITDLSNLGSIKRRLGLLREAEIDFKQVLDLMEEVFGKKHVATINANNNLALAYENQGLYESAEPLYKNSLRLSEEILGMDHITTLALMNNLAMLYESQGLFLKAEPLYKKTIELQKKISGPKHTKTISSINNLAYLYMLDDRHFEAVTLLKEVHAIWKNSLGEKHQNTLKSINNLARSYLKLNKLDLAEPLLKEAFKFRKEIFGIGHIDTIRSLNDLGVLYFQQKKFDDAKIMLTQARDLEEGFLGKLHPYTFETLNNLAALYESMSNIMPAFEIRKKIFNRRNTFFDRVLWITGENAREGYIRLHKREQNAYLSLLVKMNSNISAKEALYVSLKRKGLLLKISSEILKITKMLDKPELKALSKELMKKKKMLASLTLSGPVDMSANDFFKQIKTLEESIEEIQGNLGRTSFLFKKSIQEIKPQDIMNTLIKNEALIDFLVYNNSQNVKQLIAIVLNKNQQQISLVNYGRLKPISDLIKYYREIIQDEDSDEDDILEIGQELYNNLFLPLVKNLKGINSIYLVPDSILNIAPFDAIVDPEGEYLIKNYEIKVLSSGRDLFHKMTQTSKGEFIILAGPDYNSDYLKKSKKVIGLKNKRKLSLSDGLRMGSFGLRSLSFDPLPGAEKEGKEIESICRKLQKTILFSKANAEESQLRKLNNPQLLHIATHGFFLKSQENLVKRLLKLQRSSDTLSMIPPPGDNPLLRAGLAFAGINKNANFLGEIDTDNDGVLTALEVLGLELVGTRLIVLSACETGLGEIHEGEGVYGLRRAFQEAGASMIINSLWEVSDQGTQALMTNLYKKLLSGKPVRQAFRETQLDLINSDRWGHPYIWSAFFMVGI